ncbi:MAG: c-type cytochrome [Candidatus Eremiobacteraeota bacterium]|nr:c-type cytochrome [Candidatus Eremiobacteraeota bacterium]
MTTRNAVISIALAAACCTAVACAAAHRGNGPSGPLTLTNQATVNATATFPPGPQGELIGSGRDLITQTPRFAASFITARMSCAACHPRSGTQPHVGSLLGSYARFPQWNKRAGRFIALQDRIAECFLYSMNGKPPAYNSHEMVAITAYIAWLSRGAPVGAGFPNQGPLAVHAPAAASVSRGAAIYGARCTSCHGASGNGVGMTFPPLWGPQSFNDKAGMSRMDRIVPFVKVAMPQNAPGTLTAQEATDVAAFILSHPRPHFNKHRLIAFPPQESGYF